MLVLLAIGVCAIGNKRVASADRRVIDISFNGRRRELPIAAPVRVIGDVGASCRLR